MKNFALVYLVDDDPTGHLLDVGNDPCFDCPPSWGICRPDIRNEKELGAGSRLLFIARVFVEKKRKYYLKGYFKVKDKIDIIDAYYRFQNRQNIIISSNKSNLKVKWDNENWKTIFKESKKCDLPVFLTEFKWNKKTYYQKESDNHGIDNWKCRRIFNCNILSFKRCLVNKKCIKESQIEELKKNYILGDRNTFKDWNQWRVEWKEIARLIGKSETLMKANKHPEIELSDCEMDKIINYMNKIICCNNYLVDFKHTI